MHESFYAGNTVCLNGTAGCDSKNAPETSPIQLVRAVEIREGRLQHLLSFHGVLEPVTRARLAFQSQGVVKGRKSIQVGLSPGGMAALYLQHLHIHCRTEDMG